jgi:hypothetical protein
LLPTTVGSFHSDDDDAIMAEAVAKVNNVRALVV